MMSGVITDRAEHRWRFLHDFKKYTDNADARRNESDASMIDRKEPDQATEAILSPYKATPRSASLSRIVRGTCR